MRENEINLISEVADYYADKLARYGDTPRGVDWNGEESQRLRFDNLCRIIDRDTDFSLNDLGCGYGALSDFLKNRYVSCSYLGIDAAKPMIHAAERRYGWLANTRFIYGSEPDSIADYGVASGIFNVRLGRSESEWRAHVESALDVLNRTSRFGFSFNCLTSYSDEDKTKNYLYYADPCALFDFCKRRYSRNVALLHDYGLYEFTILVRKRA